MVLEEILLLWNFCFDRVMVEDDFVDVFVDYIVEKIEVFCIYLLFFKIFVMEIINGVLNLMGYFDEEYVKWMKGRFKFINNWIVVGKFVLVDGEYLLYIIWVSI